MGNIKKIGDLKFDAKNINKGTEYGSALLTKSLQEVGAGRSVLADKNGVLIAGNKTIEAAGAAGITKIRVIETNGDEIVVVQRTDLDINSADGAKMKIMDNTVSKHNYLEDTEVAEAICEELHLEAADLGLRILPKSKDDDFAPPEGGLDTDIVTGDYFEIGPHRLICGDSTKPATYKALFGKEMADLVVTDPPYNVDYTGKTKEKLKIGNDKMSNDLFYRFIFDFYTSQSEYAKAGSAWYVWHVDSEGMNFRKAMADAGIMVKQCLIWVKNSMVMGRQDYHWQHEPCLYGWKEGAAHAWYTDRKQTTILNFDRPSRSTDHPTMKPVELISYQINNSSKEGDIVADAFGGSGTTMVSCDQLRRKCYMVEEDPRYCQVIVNRMVKLNPFLVITKNGKPHNV